MTVSWALISKGSTIVSRVCRRQCHTQASVCLQRLAFAIFVVLKYTEEHHNNEKHGTTLKMAIGRPHRQSETAPLCSCSSLWSDAIPLAPFRSSQENWKKLSNYIPIFVFPYLVPIFSVGLWIHQGGNGVYFACPTCPRSSRISGTQSSPQHVFVKWTKTWLTKWMEKWFMKETIK